jgi:N-acetylglutamate synthase-like GNAT family acetyltransferase
VFLKNSTFIKNLFSLLQLNDIIIRNDFHSGDAGYIIYLHGKLYKEEYNYGSEFEMHVAKGFVEFFENYDWEKDRIWICEYQNKIIGSLVVMHRENDAAQLRYFLIKPEFRGVGLGKKLMQLFLNFLHECKYQPSFLWTTEEQKSAAEFYKKSGFVLTEEKFSDAFGKRVKEHRYDLKMK